MVISWFEKNTAFSWILTILIAIIIFYVSSLSFPNGTPGPEFYLKPIMYHFTIFFLLSFFLLISLIKGEKNKLILLLVFGILISIFYGILDELHQLFVPGRDSSVADALTDSAGILFSGFIYPLTLKYRKKLLKPEDFS